MYTSKVYVAFSYGDRIMKAKAKQVGDEFAQALNKRLSGEEAATPKVNVGIWQVLDTYFNCTGYTKIVEAVLAAKTQMK